MVAEPAPISIPLQSESHAKLLPCSRWHLSDISLVSEHSLLRGGYKFDFSMFMAASVVAQPQHFGQLGLGPKSPSIPWSHSYFMGPTTAFCCRT